MQHLRPTRLYYDMEYHVKYNVHIYIYMNQCIYIYIYIYVIIYICVYIYIYRCGTLEMYKDVGDSLYHLGLGYHFAMERMGKSTISMAMFNCYVSSPEGTFFFFVCVCASN